MTPRDLRPEAERPAERVPSGTGWAAWVDDACRRVEASGRWRRPRTFDALGPAGSLETGPGTVLRVVSFASNDYLGLSEHPAVIEAAGVATERWGSGAGASRLVTGSRPVHVELEAALATWKGDQRAVLFPTGFAANLSVLSVFGSDDVVIFSDELNHASIVDGCRLARASVRIFPHRDLAHLDRALGAVAGRSVVVSDTVFSMDGDNADVDGLLSVAGRHGALVILDEAHAVLGPELPAVRDTTPILRVGTLSKALGSLGGFVSGPAAFCDLLVNRGRPYIFTTAPTPADTAAALSSLTVMRSAEGDALLARLRNHVTRVSEAVGLDGHPSPIIPIVLGDEREALVASDRLLEDGLWVPAIRPPTVQTGTSRLRVTLSAAHTDEQVDRLLVALERLLGTAVRHAS